MNNLFKNFLIIEKNDEVYAKVITTLEFKKKIYNKFTIFSKDYKFSPAYKNGLWDGKIHFFNLSKSLFPIGLLEDLLKFAEEENINYEMADNLIEIGSEKDLNFLECCRIVPYDFQLKSVKDLLYKSKGLLLSPTGSGKSFIIYLLIRYLRSKNNKILIVVPSANLQLQLIEDFKSYENDDFIYSQCGKIRSSKEINDVKNNDIIIGTWKLLSKLPSYFFKKFSAFICDEAHQVNIISINKIINHCKHINYRYGFTATLDGSHLHEMQCKYYFSRIINTLTTNELIEKNVLSDVLIKILFLEHNLVKFLKYKDEIDYLINLKYRNDFLINLALTCEKNTILLFNHLTMGDYLYDEMNKKASSYNKKIYIITGSILAKERENIRKSIEENNNAILLATYGTIGFGINIKNLYNIILAHPYKAKIRILQAIGRSLRKYHDKIATIYDLVDNFYFSRKHYKTRLLYYKQENFKIKLIKITNQ